MTKPPKSRNPVAAQALDSGAAPDVHSKASVAPDSALEACFYQALADPAMLGAFEDLMLERELYAVPATGSAGATADGGEPKRLEAGEQLSLRGVILSDGRESITLFTDPRRAIQMFGEGAQVIAMQGRVLLGMLKNRPLLFNPDGNKGLLMSADRVEELLQR